MSSRRSDLRRTREIYAFLLQSSHQWGDVAPIDLREVSLGQVLGHIVVLLGVNTGQ